MGPGGLNLRHAQAGFKENRQRAAIHSVGAMKPVEKKFRNGAVWWGEASGEPAREDVRLTGNCKMGRHRKLS